MISADIYIDDKSLFALNMEMDELLNCICGSAPKMNKTVPAPRLGRAPGPSNPHGLIFFVQSVFTIVNLKLLTLAPGSPHPRYQGG